MNTRQEILADIGSAITRKNSGDTDIEARKTLALRRINEHPRGIIPQKKTGSRRSSTALFCEKVRQSHASIVRVKSYNKIGPAVLSYLHENNYEAALRIGKDKRLEGLDWGKSSGPEIKSGASDGNDAVCMSHAIGAVSETGTLYLASGADNPSTLNFLPQAHIIVVRKEDIRKSFEGMWKTIRRKYGKGKMPRTINLITGPSRSADIEQTLILGAHGPLKVHIILVEEGRKP